MIPAEKQAAVTHAMQVAFGTAEMESITPITIGLSTALTYKIVVLGKAYLLRVTTRTDAVSDPTHYYKCMQPAAEAGIAPRVLYASIPGRISITDFIDAKPFTMAQARGMMPVLLQRLHALPPFPYRVNYLDVSNTYVQKYKALNLLPESYALVFTQYEKIAAVYPRTTDDWVACHTDLKKDNILYDGEKVWLVDWEAAFLNDRYVDLAAIANFIITNREEETAFLAAYFGEAPTPYQCARFFLMQQVIHLFCFCLCASIAGGGQPVDLHQPVPGFHDFHNGLWEANITLGDNTGKLKYALVHLQKFIHNMQLPRFEESLLIVANQQG